MAIRHISWWISGGQRQQHITVNGSSLNSSPDSGLWDQNNVNFSSVKGIASSSRRIKRKWNSREERKIDREHDIVLVPSDGGCVSDSESDGSDWSIGWLEPHGPGFQTDDDSETDDSFAVLVPCYGRLHQDLELNPKNITLGAFGKIADGYSDESKKYMEQWLSSLQS